MDKPNDETCPVLSTAGMSWNGTRLALHTRKNIRTCMDTKQTQICSTNLQSSGSSCGDPKTLFINASDKYSDSHTVEVQSLAEQLDLRQDEGLHGRMAHFDFTCASDGRFRSEWLHLLFGSSHAAMHGSPGVQCHFSPLSWALIAMSKRWLLMARVNLPADEGLMTCFAYQ